MSVSESKSAVNLNMLFVSLMPNFSHLATIEPKTKDEFLTAIRTTYDTANPKTAMFYQSAQHSTFETIRLNNTRDAILFNE